MGGEETPPPLLRELRARGSFVDRRSNVLALDRIYRQDAVEPEHEQVAGGVQITPVGPLQTHSAGPAWAQEPALLHC